MMVTTCAGASRGRRWRARVGLVGAAFLLAPVLVVASPAGVAGAAVVTTTAATVAARAAAPGVATICAGGGPVTWTICGVGAVALAGAALYYTRDTWMPWLGLGGGSSTVPADTSLGSWWAGAVTIGFTAPPAVNSATNLWVYGVTMTNTAAFTTPDPTWDVLSTCVTSGVVTTGRSSVRKGSNFLQGEAFSMSGNVCGAGSQLVALTLTPCMASCSNIGIAANSITWTSDAWATNAPADAPVAQRDAAAAAALRMHFRTEVTCRNAAGTTTSIIVAVSTRAPVMPSCVDRLGAGWVPVKSDTWGNFDSGSIKALPPQTLTAQRDALYPNCAGTACTLVVHYLGAACTEGASGCVNWTQGVATNPGDYACRYGGYTLSISSCHVIERLYQAGGAVLPITGPNTDGNPLTGTQPQVQPSTGSPTTTTQVINPTQPSTGTSPGTGTGTNTAPLPGPGAPATGAGGGSTQVGAGECWPNGWGWFNPAEWVLRPVACAFVPSAATQTRMSAIGTSVQTRAPVGYVRAASGFMNQLANVGSSCWRQSLTVGPFGTVSVIDTCTPGTIEGYVIGQRSLWSAVVWLSMLAPLVFWAFREYAFGSKGVA